MGVRGRRASSTKKIGYISYIHVTFCMKGKTGFVLRDRAQEPGEKPGVWRKTFEGKCENFPKFSGLESHQQMLFWLSLHQIFLLYSMQR